MAKETSDFNWDAYPDAHPDIPKENISPKDGSLIDTIKDHAKAVGQQYARAGQTATDFINSAGRGAVSAALPLTGINTEKLAGGVGAVGDVLTGDNPLPKDLSMDEIKSFGKRMGVSYDDAKKFAENYKKQEEDRSPVASTLGKLGGAVAGGGALMKGLGAVGTAAGQAAPVGSTLSKVAPMVGELGSGKMIGNAAGIAEEGGGVGGAIARTGAKAVEGVPLGAVYGADMDPDNKLRGATTGAAMGSVAGLIAGGAYEGGKAINNAWKAGQTVGQGNKYTRQLQLARQVAREGVDVPATDGGTEKINSIYTDANKINMGADQTAHNATEQIYGAKKNINNMYGGVLSDLDDQGVTLVPKSDDLLAIQQVQNTSNDYPAIFGQPAETANTRDLLNKFSQGTLTPSEGKALQKGLRQAMTKADAKQMGPQSSHIENALNSVTEQMNNLPEPETGGPGYKEVNNMFKDFADTAGSIVNKGEKNPDYTTKWLSDLKSRSDIKNVMKEMIDFVQAPGASGDEKELVLNKVANHFNDLETQRPGFLKSQGIDFNTIKKNINDMSDLVNLSRSARFQNPEAGVVNKILGASSPLGATLVGKVEKVVPEFTQKLFSAPTEMLRSITPDLPDHVATALSNAINTGDQAKSNAVLFSIVQNPDLRKRVNKRLGLSPEME